MDFENRVAVVTGMAAGIGKAACEALLARGAVVIGADIAPEEKLDAAVKASQNFIYRPTDVTDESAVKALFAFVAESFGRADILLNVAGGWKGKYLLEDTPTEQWDFIMKLNLYSTFFTCRAAVPLMKKNRYGRIVNVASISGRQPLGRSTVAYAASKGGVVALTRYIAGELGEFGITVNAVAPATTLTQRCIAARSPEDLANIAKKMPVGRLGLPEDTVDAILFLLSERTGFITGHTIDVNGGTYMN